MTRVRFSLLGKFQAPLSTPILTRCITSSKIRTLVTIISILPVGTNSQQLLIIRITYTRLTSKMQFLGKYGTLTTKLQVATIYTIRGLINSAFHLTILLLPFLYLLPVSEITTLSKSTKRMVFITIH